MTALEEKLNELREEAKGRPCGCGSEAEDRCSHKFGCGFVLPNPTVLRLVEAVEGLRGGWFEDIDHSGDSQEEGLKQKEAIDSRLLRILSGEK